MVTTNNPTWDAYNIGRGGRRYSGVVHVVFPLSSSGYGWWAATAAYRPMAASIARGRWRAAPRSQAVFDAFSFCFCFQSSSSDPLRAQRRRAGAHSPRDQNATARLRRVSIEHYSGFRLTAVSYCRLIRLSVAGFRECPRVPRARDARVPVHRRDVVGAVGGGTSAKSVLSGRNLRGRSR